MDDELGYVSVQKKQLFEETDQQEKDLLEWIDSMECVPGVDAAWFKFARHEAERAMDALRHAVGRIGHD